MKDTLTKSQMLEIFDLESNQLQVLMSNGEIKSCERIENKSYSSIGFPLSIPINIFYGALVIYDPIEKKFIKFHPQSLTEPLFEI